MFSIYRKFFLALKKIQMANVFSFEKGSNCQNHSSSFHLLIKKSGGGGGGGGGAKLLIPPPPHTTGKFPFTL